MKVCIAEKPSVAREIAAILGANNSRAGYLEGNGYQVTWVFGHLCELKEPHDYVPMWRQWNKYDLPILPDKFDIKLKKDKGVEQQFNTIKFLIQNAEEVINCGDAGQEGELIQRWVYKMAGMRCPMKRLWISSLTEDAIREGFANLKDGHDFDQLYLAGYARAVGDWLLGMNATRAYTLRFARERQVLSIGRVQTPTLALIVNRHLEIANFKPETYWELKTKYRGVMFTSAHGKFNKQEDASSILEKITDKPFEITNVQIKEGMEAPPRLFDLTSLQVECNKKYAFSADQTLQLIQSLYEKKLTTYPRVDTTYLPDDLYPKVPQTLKGLIPYKTLVDPLLQQPKLRKSKKVFDNSKVTDHHAIIPTGVPPSSSLPRDEKLVYDLIARRFIANFYPDSKVSTTSVQGRVEDVEFKCSGKQILDPAWRVVFGAVKSDDDNQDEQNQTLPDFQNGESGPHVPSLGEKQTQPPKPYTEATLLRAMETAGKQVDDEELRDLMKDNGIGRPSTRAAIIETLFRRHYITKERKNLIPTETGIQLIGLIRIDILKSVEMTGQWEKKLRMIEKGQFEALAFMNEMRLMVTDVVRNVDADNSTIRIGSSPDAPVDASKIDKKAKAPKAAKPAQNEVLECPSCHKPVMKGKTAWGCIGFREGCQFRIPFEFMGKKLTDAQVKTLLSKGETSVIKGFVSSDGESVSGKLMFDGNFNLTLRQQDEKPLEVSTLACPLCGKPMAEGRAAWGCTGFREGCQFRVPFEYMHKKLTATHLSVLCKKRKTGVVSGFVDEFGNKLSGRLSVADDGKVVFEKG